MYNKKINNGDKPNNKDSTSFKSNNSIKTNKSLDSIHDQIEKIAEIYQNKIENIFEVYEIDKFAEISMIESKNCYLSICNHEGFDPNDFANLKKVVSDFNGLSFSMQGDSLSENVYKILKFMCDISLLCSKILKDFEHYFGFYLFTFCVSFLNTITSEISFIVNYEKMIAKHKNEVKKELNDLKTLLRHNNTWNKTPVSCIENCKNFVSILEPLRSIINKVYYYVLEWVLMDRDYLEQANSLLNSLSEEADEINTKRNYNKTAVNRLEPTITNLKKKYDNIKDNYKAMAIKHKNTSIAIETTTRMLKRSSKDSEKWLSLKRHIRSLKNENLYINEILIDSKKEMKSIKSKLNLYHNEHEMMRNEEAKTANALDRIIKQIKDLKLVIGRKKCIDSVSAFGTNNNNSSNMKGKRILAEMCEFVSTILAHHWPKLYMNLPMKPERAIEKRLFDIDCIKNGSGKIVLRDLSPANEAKAALGRWRTISHNNTPEDLTSALVISGFATISNSLLRRYPAYFNTPSKHNTDFLFLE